MLKTSVRRVGNSLGITLPKTVIDNYHLSEGDELHLVETDEGVVITPFNPELLRGPQHTAEPTRNSATHFMHLGSNGYSFHPPAGLMPLFTPNSVPPLFVGPHKGNNS